MTGRDVLASCSGETLVRLCQACPHTCAFEIMIRIPAMKAANEGGSEGSGSGALWCCESDFRLVSSTTRCVSDSMPVIELIMQLGELVNSPL